MYGAVNDIIVSEFELQSRFYFYLLIPLWKVKPYPHSYGLNRTATGLLQGRI